MRTIVLSALVLGAMMSLASAEPAKPTAAQAGPIELTDTQMDAVVAGTQGFPPSAAEAAAVGLGTAGLAREGAFGPPQPPSIPDDPGPGPEPI